MPSLRRGHAHLLCIAPVLVYVLPERARNESILIDFSDNFSETTPTSTHSCFLKVCCNMESKAVAVNFLCFIILKFIGLLFLHDFETSCIGHLENFSSLSYIDLPNFDTFHYSVSKYSYIGYYHH